MRTTLAAITAVALMTGTGAAAQTAATAVPSKAVTKAPVVRTAKSLDCSKQADAKNLHGKTRKGFMSSCKKA